MDCVKPNECQKVFNANSSVRISKKCYILYICIVIPKKSLSLYKKLQKLLIYTCIVLFGARCAQITPLTGGKKDVTPPKQLSSVPENASLNFKSKTIEVQFDEYITIKDIANQFIITPQTKETPEIQAQGKKLKITFNETLLPNTTYKLAFGNAISDLNESNTLSNFEFIFSTGSTIDSLKIQGKIINAINMSPSANILVGLYDAKSNDSIIYREKPLYISKTNQNGEFKFNYLPNASFKIVGISDQNKNLLYDGSEEQIAFTKGLVKTSDTTLRAPFLLFKETPSKSFIKKSFSLEYGKVYIIFNKPQLDIKKVAADGLLDYTLNTLKDSLTLFFDNKFDTLKTYIQYEAKKADTLYINILSSTAYDRQNNNNAIKYNLKPNFSTFLPFYVMPSFELNFPVRENGIIAEKISLIEKIDSLTKNLSFKILNESKRNALFTVQADFKPETNYTLTIQKGAISGNSKRMNDSVSYQFKTTALDDYALLKMKLLFPKKENYLVRLLNDKEQLINEKLVELSLTSTSEKIIEYNNLLPGNYFIRVVEDVNKNGLFDMGDYFLGTQPETIFVNTTAIKLLAGWEIENDWIVK